jgi:hypothetical protein
LTVTNPYYEFDPNFTPFTKARAGDNNLQFQAIQNAFDLLPGDPDALTTDTATFAPESGSGNAYVVTMPDTRTSNQDGDGIRFFATHTNTGAATLDVDGLGPIAFVNWDGDTFVGNEIVSGRIYEVRYDAANAQFVLAATTDNVLQVGYAEEWAIQPEDVPVSVAAGGDGVTEFSAFHWAQKSLASAITGRVNTDIATATPPTTEGVTGAYEIYDADDDDLLMRLGYQGSNTLVLQNRMHGGDIRIGTETAGGLLHEPIRITGSNGEVQIFHGATVNIQTGPSFAFAKTSYSGNLQQILTIGDQSLFSDLLTAYTFEAATSGDPGQEEFGFDSATLTSITELRIDGSNLIEYNRFEVTGAPVDSGGYWTIPVNFVGGTAGAFSALQEYSIFILPSSIENESLRADIVTATDPTTEAVTALRKIYDEDGTDLLAQEGFNGSNVYAVQNKMHGGGYLVTVEDSTGTENKLLESNPSGGAGGDPDFANVQLLADLNGADGATVYTEVSQNGFSATFVGNAELDTGAVKFGTASGLFDGTGDYITFADNAAFNLSSSVWTIEGWVYLNSLPAVGDEMTLISQWSTSTSTDEAFAISLIQDGGDYRIRFVAEDGVGVFEQGGLGGAPSLGVWIHFAAQRSAGDTLSLWWDGTLEFEAGGIFSGAIQDSTETLKLGVFDPTDGFGNEAYLDGNIDDVRMTIGSVRYSTGGAITPPTSAFPTSGGAPSFDIYDGDGNLSAKAVDPATGGLFANNTLTGAGEERVLTESDAGSSSVDARVLTDIATATPPTFEAVTGNFTIYDADDDDQLMRLGFDASDNLTLRNYMHDGRVIIEGESSAGVVRTLADFDPDTGGELFWQGIARLAIGASGEVDVKSDDNVDTSARRYILAHQNGTNRGFFGQLGGSTDLLLRQEIHGADVRIQAEDAGGTVRDLFTGDPDGITAMYAFNGIHRWNAQSSGRVALRSDGNTDTEERRIMFDWQDGSDRGYIGYASSDILRVKNEIHGGNVLLEAEDGSGVVRNLWQGDPDGNITESAPGAFFLTVANAVSTKVAIVCGDAGTQPVDLYAAGIHRLRTQDPTDPDNQTGISISGPDGVLTPAGLCGSKDFNISIAGVNRLTNARQHGTLRVTGGTSTLQTENATGTAQTDIRNGSMWQVWNMSGSSTTIAPGTSVTLTWLDGAGGATGTRTLADRGVCMVQKLDDDEYFIWGNGLS